MSNKIARAAALLSKLKHYLPTSTLLIIYNSLIHSHLNYSIVAWGFNNCTRLQKIQKRAVRNIVNAKYNAHTNHIFNSLGVLKVTDIFKYSCLKLFHKIRNNDVPEYFGNFAPPVPDNPRGNRERKLPIKFNNTTVDVPVLNPKLTPIFTNYKCTRNCLRVYLPDLVNGHTIDTQVWDKLNTHSFMSFCKYAKNAITDKYTELCRGCYICRIPPTP